MLSGLLYAKYRQLLEAKCFRAGAEPILIDPAYTSTIGAMKYAARRGWRVHAAAAGVIARRRQKLTERLRGAGTVIRVPVRGGHHALELPARIAGDSRVAAWHRAHAAYRGVVRGQRLAARGGKPHQRAKCTYGAGACAASLNRDHCSPCDDDLREQILHMLMQRIGRPKHGIWARANIGLFVGPARDPTFANAREGTQPCRN
jgi:hypothetical protein